MKKTPTHLILLLLAAILAWALYSQNTAAVPVKAQPGVAFRILFGAHDTEPSQWDGNIRLTDGQVASIEGWLFTGSDAVDGQTAWKAATRYSPAGNREIQQQFAHGPLFPNGLIVSLTGVTPLTEASIHTAQGDFSFRLSDAPFGETKPFLNGRVQLARVPTTTRLTGAPADEDFPATAQTPDGLLLAYVSHTGDTRFTSWVPISQAPDFDSLAKPTGGDQVMLMRYDNSTRTFTAPEPVSAPKQDCMGVAVARDSHGRTWVIWSDFRNGNFDLYARYQQSGQWSPEIRLTTDAGTDIHPVAATDSAGRVWIAWQGFRAGALSVLAAVQEGDTFGREHTVSISHRSNWTPSIAAAPTGGIAIAWDTYDKGDYDVYLRRLNFQKSITQKSVTMDKPIAVAASTNFEARPSIAFDAQARLWVAYETGPRLWGKNFGTYDSSGSPLYGRQNIAVKCYRGDQALVTADDPAELLAIESKNKISFPDPALARNRPPNGFVVPPVGLSNSIPRLAVAPDGQVYLAYRIEAVGRSTAGPIWFERVLWFDGDRWRGPVLAPHSDNFLDNRPALAAQPGGHLWMIATTDHRQAATPGHRGLINNDLYAAEFDFASKPQPARLEPAPAASPSAPEPEAAAEALQIRQIGSGTGLHLLRGELHRHTTMSVDGGDDGSLEDAYRYMIDAASMDWFACCDHDNGTNEYSWWIEQTNNDAYNLGSRFIPMFGYERSVMYPEGHRNVIFAQRGIRPLARLPKVANNAPFSPAPDTQMLYQYLKHFDGVVAAHQTTTVGGTDWRNNDPAVETSVEIFQGLRQSAERPDAPKAVTDKDHLSGYFPAGYVSKALEKGYRLAFESSSDHYSTHESYTLLWAAVASRQGVLDAFHKRRLYAASDNILADVRCGSHMMGDEFSVTEPPELSVKLIGTAPFAHVRIVKDNRYVYLLEPNTKTVEFRWRDQAAEKGSTSFYYVRGEQSDGALVWASPMWIHY